MALSKEKKKKKKELTPSEMLTFRSLLRQPVVKSIGLTFLFGSAVVDFASRRKEYESLKENYHSKFQVLEDLADDLRNGRNVDVAKELQIANTLTKFKYNSIVDVHLDEQINSFIKHSTEDEHNDDPLRDTVQEQKFL